MADGYADIAAITAGDYQAYAATPTWGALSTDKPLPMDGNGKGSNSASAVVAIAEIQITVLPADTNTLVIAGCTLTAKTTAAAKNQWTISGAISTCITNLRDLINTFGTGTAQCDAATPTTVSALQLALPYWCFARVKPGTTDTLQIATRFAGSDLNQATNSNVGITSSGWGTPPTITQFAGGADGPWAYLLNTTTVFGKSDGKTGTGGPAYGLFFAASPTPFDPGTSDVVHVRTKRSGSDLSVTWNSTGTASAAWKQRNYLFDDGTVWASSNGKLTCAFKNSNGSSTGSVFTLAAAGTLSFASRGVGNFEIQTGVTASGSGTFMMVSMGNSAKFSFKRCRWVETSDNLRSIYLASDGNSSLSGWFVDLSDSFVQLRTSVTNKFPVQAGGSTTVNIRVVLNGLTVEVVAASANIGKFISLAGASQAGTVEWIGGEVRDSLGVYRCPMPFDINVGCSLDSIVDGVIGVSNPSVGMTASATVNARFRWISPEGPNKGMRSETPRAVIDWQGDGTFPYCGAAADLRGVNWAHRFTWTSIPSAWAPVMVARIPRFYRSASASKTIKLFLYLPTATTVYLDELEMTISYLDSTDVWRTESVGGARGLQFAASRTALSSSSASWTANNASDYSAKEIAITTAYSIKQNSEFVLRLALCASRGSSLTGYYSPEPGVS